MQQPGLIHQRTHPGLDVDSCYGCKLANVGIAASGRGVAQVQAAQRNEADFDRDGPAYKRLRANGVERVINGSARAEATANTEREASR